MRLHSFAPRWYRWPSTFDYLGIERYTQVLGIVDVRGPDMGWGDKEEEWQDGMGQSSGGEREDKRLRNEHV